MARRQSCSIPNLKRDHLDQQQVHQFAVINKLLHGNRYSGINAKSNRAFIHIICNNEMFHVQILIEAGAFPVSFLRFFAQWFWLRVFTLLVKTMRHLFIVAGGRKECQ